MSNLKSEKIVDYTKIIDSAIRQVVFIVLNALQKSEFDDDCANFLISFRTDAAGVKLSNRIKKLYPKEITIVLQYQFEDLVVERDKFAVTLFFSGIKERIEVPYSALIAFADPSAKFSLNFLQGDIQSKDYIPSKDIILKDEYRNTIDYRNIENKYKDVKKISKNIDSLEKENRLNSTNHLDNVISIDKFRN